MCLFVCLFVCLYVCLFVGVCVVSVSTWGVCDDWLPKPASKAVPHAYLQ